MPNALKKSTAALAAILIATAILSGCTAKNDGGVPSSGAATQDRAGNAITYPQKAEKIISMSPAFTEVVLALGLDEKLVAVDTYSAYTVPGIPEGIVQFDMLSPDVESIIALQPDIVLATGMSMVNGEDPFKPVTDAGICLAYIPSSNSIAEIMDDIKFIGDLTGRTDRAVEIIEGMDRDIQEIRKIGKSIAEKKTVYFEIGPEPQLYTFGNNVYLNEMLEIIGAVNIFADMDSWVSVSEENVIAANPDVIILNYDYVQDPITKIIERNGWGSITAVQTGQIYEIAPEITSHPNQSIVRGLKEMAKYIYPEEFGELK